MSDNNQEMDGEGEDFDDGPVDVAALSAIACSDPLPEYTQYRDEGCGLSNSCLNCPFLRCIYDMPGGIHRYEKDKQAREIVFLYGRGLTAKQIASMVDDSVRKVQRVIMEFKRNAVIDTENERETWDE